MNKEIQASNFAGQIEDKERGFRVVIGSAAIIAVLAGALPEVQQVVAASFLCIYTVMTAIVGLDPVYAITETFSRRTRISRRLALNYK